MTLNHEEQQFRKMTETPVEKLILSLGVPTIISMLAANIYNLADTYFVGTISTSASGATGVVFGLMAILQAFGFMLGHGSGTLLPPGSHGARQKKPLERRWWFFFRKYPGFS